MQARCVRGMAAAASQCFALVGAPDRHRNATDANAAVTCCRLAGGTRGSAAVDGRRFSSTMENAILGLVDTIARFGTAAQGPFPTRENNPRNPRHAQLKEANRNKPEVRTHVTARL
jgi:hypothetical protein